MHAEAHDFVRRTLQTLPPLYSVVEFGGRNINGSVRPLFTNARTYVSIDKIPGPGVDIVGDALDYRPPEPVDCVVCCEVLEHAIRPHLLVAHAIDILRPGGVLIVTCATTGRAPHSTTTGGALLPNEYYRNIDRQEVHDWFGTGGVLHFTVILNDNAHDLYCTAVKA